MGALYPFEPNGLVTLTTDFGTRDGYVGAMKGVLYTLGPALRVVDLTHDIPPGDIAAGARALGQAGPLFPAGTVHVAVVDPTVGSARAGLVVRCGEQLYVGPDNGLFTEVFLADPAGCAYGLVRPDLVRTPVSPTFHGRDVFAPVAAALASGRVRPEDVGPAARPLLLHRPPPQIDAARASGVVLGADRFGNLATSLPFAALPAALQTAFVVELAGRRVAGPLTCYADAPSGSLLALIDSRGFIEIAVRDGSADALLGGVAPGTPLTLTPAGAPAPERPDGPAVIPAGPRDNR